MKKVKLACLIEDDDMMVLISKKFMGATGAFEEVISFKNGKEAYDNLKAMLESGKSLPELIFLDLNMPIWDGWIFLEEFKRLPVSDNIIIYILTSSISNEDFEKAKIHGLEERYLMKPLGINTLREILSTLL